jgi:hypothetical protein
MSDFTGEPVTLVPGTLRGYRQWTVSTEMTLTAIAQDYVWPSGTATASCVVINRFRKNPYRDVNIGGPHPMETVPDAGCTCGFYAVHSPIDNQVVGPSVLCPNRQIMGVVEAWGNVQLGPRGFRAQHARIVALAFQLPDPTLAGNPFRHSRWTPYGRDFYVHPDGRILSSREMLDEWRPQDWQGELRRNYPKTIMCRSRDAMLEQFPPVSTAGLVAPRKPRARLCGCAVCRLFQTGMMI